jgi:hypothetical protein
MDLYAGHDGTETIRTIAQDIPRAKTVSMSVHRQATRLMRQAGACAHMEKSDLLTTLSPTVRMALDIQPPHLPTAEMA